MDKLRNWLSKRSKLVAFGVILTLSYFGWIIYTFNTRLLTIKTLELNAVGDFLAGAFGPVAFLWLVIGYLMQNQELKSQIQEMSRRNSIEESRIKEKMKEDKIEEARRHFDFTHSQPIFEMSIQETFDIENFINEYKEERVFLSINCTNIGKDITSVMIIQNENIVKKIKKWPRSENYSFQIYLDIKTGVTNFLIDFHDINGIPQKFLIYIGQNSEAKWEATFDKSENMRP